MVREDLAQYIVDNIEQFPRTFKLNLSAKHKSTVGSNLKPIIEGYLKNFHWPNEVKKNLALRRKAMKDRLGLPSTHRISYYDLISLERIYA